MARIYTTAHGKTVDIERLRTANEEVIAVGNMKVNARGDKLGGGGQVAETRNQIQDNYNRLNTPVAVEVEPTVASAPSIASGVNVQQGAPIDPVELAAVPTPVEVAVPVEESVPDPNPVPELRSQLAQSLAAPKAVKQELLKDPRRPVGPARI
jgi:hypothetical protein